VDRAELVEQIEVTLLHELGHYLGFDEDGVDELGLG
jgi:predicted Zn-dependent protease with MMP-like domain